MVRRDPIPVTPIACSLGPSDVTARLEEWRGLRALAVGSAEPVDGGLRLRFPADLADEVRRLAAAESECCAFLAIDVSVHPDGVVLAVTGPREARPVIEALLAPSSS